MLRPEDQWGTIELGESLAGRKAGGSAAEKARELRHDDPLTVVRSGLFRQRTDERAWRKGANGERFAGWVLGGLPDGWFTFNDIPVGVRGANIDHLVVGPAGVFTVNTKNLAGNVVIYERALYVNGWPTPYYPEARHEAKRASRLLSEGLGDPVEVTGALAIIAEDIGWKGWPHDLMVRRPRGLKRQLLALPPHLSARDVAAIAGVAHKPDTWTGTRPGAPTSAASPDDANRACSCGGRFVERSRRSDGKKFLGCDRYPKCRRTRQLPGVAEVS